MNFMMKRLRSPARARAYFRDMERTRFEEYLMRAKEKAREAHAALDCVAYTRLLVKVEWFLFAVTLSRDGGFRTMRLATERDLKLGTKLYF